MDECDWDYEDDLIEDDFRIEPGKSYKTLSFNKAVVMYFIEPKPGDLMFFGHIYEQTAAGIIPLAVQWDVTGRVDLDLYDKGYTLVSLWNEPKKYIRYIFICQDDSGAEQTIVSHTSTCPTGRKLLAAKKVTLTGL